MRMPFRRSSYLTDIVDEIVAATAVLGVFLIGWHGWSLSRAKLAKHLAILAALVNRLILLMALSKFTQRHGRSSQLFIPA